MTNGNRLALGATLWLAASLAGSVAAAGTPEPQMTDAGVAPDGDGGDRDAGDGGPDGGTDASAADAAPSPPVPAPPAPPPAALPPAPELQVLDVRIRGTSAAQRLRESAAPVTVVDTTQAKLESADLATVLARVPGISIRRSGGLGSYARIALNGLTDEQIRYYLDDVPLDMAGFGLGLQNTPVNLVERVEIYRGIVPVRFGADALGGLFNLVTMDDVRGTHASTSMEVGSFGTARFTFAARALRPQSGLFAGISTFLDRADNDYLADVKTPGPQGSEIAARVPLFHNGYAAGGAMADVGLVDRPWAKRLILRLYGNRQENELQSNFVMTVPYGEAKYGETTFGANLRYEQPRLAGTPFGAEALVAYARRTIDFRDLATAVYNWYGQQTRVDTNPGELGNATDRITWDDKLVGRLTLSWDPLTWQSVRLSIAPTYDQRTGRNDRSLATFDRAAALYRYLTVFAGAEYEVNLFERKLQAITFGKGFSYNTWSEKERSDGRVVSGDQAIANAGAGEELRYLLTPRLWLKASYELTTRFPSPQEVFGNGVRTIPNPSLRPERSHNANLSVTLDRQRFRLGEVRFEVNLFFRQATDLIVFLTNIMDATYVNVNTARSQGVEGAAGWTSPQGAFTLDSNVTWQDFRNRSAGGTFGMFEGDRIPNRPWLMANVSARANATSVSTPGDRLSLGYYLRYVHGYYRGWESVGLLDSKQVIPTQLTHDVVLTYTTQDRTAVTWSLEVDNLAGARVYDFYGLQRPGRAAYAKMTLTY